MGPIYQVFLTNSWSNFNVTRILVQVCQQILAKFVGDCTFDYCKLESEDSTVWKMHRMLEQMHTKATFSLLVSNMSYFVASNTIYETGPMIFCIVPGIHLQ